MLPAISTFDIQEYMKKSKEEKIKMGEEQVLALIAHNLSCIADRLQQLINMVKTDRAMSGFQQRIITKN